jgi:GPH family glycoside/pentoside/hexuronide:cation symporter
VVETDGALPISIRVQRGVGGLGAALLMNAVGGLVLYYLTRLVGVSGWLAGLLLSVARLYDAFLDPAIGQISDRTNSRYGRRRPYMLAGAFLSAISIVLVFTTPFHGVTLISTSYVFLTLVIYGTAYSIFNVPYVSMPAEMTGGYNERSALHGWRVMFASAGSALAGSGSGLLLAWLAAPRTPKGHAQVNTAQDYALIAVIYAVIILVTMLIAWRGTKTVPITTKTERMLPWRGQVASLLANKPFLLVLGAKVFQLIGIAASQAASFFFVVEVLKVGSGGLALLGLPAVAFSFVITPFLERLQAGRLFRRRLLHRRRLYLMAVGQARRSRLDASGSRPDAWGRFFRQHHVRPLHVGRHHRDRLLSYRHAAGGALYLPIQLCREILRRHWSGSGRRGAKRRRLWENRHRHAAELPGGAPSHPVRHGLCSGRLRARGIGADLSLPADT